jgi:general secretion pathway protein M
MKLPVAFLPLQARWQTLGTREQTLIQSAAAVVGLACVWWGLVAPPLATLRQADALQHNLDAQAQKMQVLQAQAKVLQSQPKLSRDDAMRALDTSVKQRLGPSAQLNAQGDRVTVTLKNTSADALAQWLVQARVNARAIPSEARLVRAATPANPAMPANQGSRTPSAWDGTLVLSLPAP